MNDTGPFFHNQLDDPGKEWIAALICMDTQLLALKIGVIGEQLQAGIAHQAGKIVPFTVFASESARNISATIARRGLTGKLVAIEPIHMRGNGMSGLHLLPDLVFGLGIGLGPLKFNEVHQP